VLLVVMAVGCGLGFFYCNWIFLSIVGGTMVAKLLRLIRVTSFLCYFMIVLLASTKIIVKSKFDVFFFFDSWNHITIDGIAQGFTMHALTFISLSKFTLVFANCATSFL
jgi:hypothetical protein